MLKQKEFRLTEEMVRQIQGDLHHAKERAWQVEDKARQADEYRKQVTSKLDAALNSRTWRFTAPPLVHIHSEITEHAWGVTAPPLCRLSSIARADNHAVVALRESREPADRVPLVPGILSR